MRSPAGDLRAPVGNLPSPLSRSFGRPNLANGAAALQRWQPVAAGGETTGAAAKRATLLIENERPDLAYLFVKPLTRFSRCKGSSKHGNHGIPIC